MKRALLRIRDARTISAIKHLGSILLVSLLTLQAASAFSIRYILSVENPESRLYHVRIEIADNDLPTLCLNIPAWTPGYYRILNYYPDIRSFTARSGEGRELNVSRPNNLTWQIEAGQARNVVAE